MGQSSSGIAAVLTAAVIAFGCGSERKSAVPTAKMPGSADALTSQLEDAYRSNSDDQLAAFFRHWHETVQPVDIGAVQDPLERELVALYSAFFRPFNVDELMGQLLQDTEETYNNRYENAKYLVVPTELRFRVGKGAEETLSDFRPDVRGSRIPVVFLTSEYREALVRFLEDRGRVRDAGSANKSDDGPHDWFERFQFINRQITVMPGHWDGWDLLSYPTIILIELNDELTEAHISWSDFSLIGMTVMHRESGRWKLKDSGVIGMQ